MRVRVHAATARAWIAAWRKERCAVREGISCMAISQPSGMCANIIGCLSSGDRQRVLRVLSLYVSCVLGLCQSGLELCVRAYVLMCASAR